MPLVLLRVYTLSIFKMATILTDQHLQQIWIDIPDLPGRLRSTLLANLFLVDFLMLLMFCIKLTDIFIVLFLFKMVFIHRLIDFVEIQQGYTLVSLDSSNIFFLTWVTREQSISVFLLELFYEVISRLFNRTLGPLR